MENVIERYVRESREKQRQLFGEVGLKEDCIHYQNGIEGEYCIACTDCFKTRQAKLQCEYAVCYFYQRREGK